jgi:hypothetical protein
MWKYEDIFTNYSGAFPNTLAVNVTTPGAGDGTEFIAAGVNDSWGFHQALMAYADLIPDSVTEAPGTSQMVEAMRLSFGHPGEVVGWHGQADPATLGLRLLMLEGQGVLRANYPLLDAAVYCGDANNGTWEAYYHATDQAGTTRSTTGDWLILADTRGLVLRGYDLTEENDPLGSTRKFPDIQEDSIQAHIHTVRTTATAYYAKVATMPTASGARNVLEPLAGATDDRLQAGDMVPGSPQNPDETRMVNFQVKWCVRY